MHSNSFTKAGLYTYQSNTGSTTIETSGNFQGETFTVAGFGGGDMVRPTAGSFTRVRNKGWVGTKILADNPFPRKYIGNGIQTYTHYSAPVDWAVSQAMLYNRALSSLNGQLRGSVDLSIDLAEAGQTRKMLRDMSKIVRYIKSVNPSNWAKRWLEYQYGIRPLINSVYQTYHQIMAPARKPSYRLRGSSSDEDRKKYSFGQIAGVPIQRLDVDSCRCSILAQYSIVEPSVLQSFANYSSINPASIAWELTPFSFVADWFIDIGGYLRNMETGLLYMNNLDWAGVTFTRKWSRNQECYGTTTSGTVAASQVTDYIYKQRLRYSSLPFPNLPRFSAKLGWQRCLSAAALIYDHIGHR